MLMPTIIVVLGQPRRIIEGGASDQLHTCNTCIFPAVHSPVTIFKHTADTVRHYIKTPGLSSKQTMQIPVMLMPTLHRR